MKEHIVKDLGRKRVGKSVCRFALIKCPICSSIDERRVRNNGNARCRPCALQAIRDAKKPSVSGTEGDTSKNHKYNRLYRIWRGIYRRCYDKGMTGYDKYGAKGVTMCGDWKNSYKSFKAWALSSGYKEDAVIDKDELCEVNKIHPKIYSPSTCIWKTVRENSKTNEKIPEKELVNISNALDNGEKTPEYYAELFGVSRKQVLQRTRGLRTKRYPRQLNKR